MRFLPLLAGLTGFVLTARAATPLDHGDQQVETMLKDRPAMAQCLTIDGTIKKITSDDAIWVAAAQAYDQKIVGSTIDWDPSPLKLKPPIGAEHSDPWQGRPALIRLRIDLPKDGREMPASFEQLWSHCVFELFNVANDEQFLAIYQRALHGEISRQEWLDLNTRLEFTALVKLRNYFTETWKPWCDKNHVAYDPAIWLRGFSPNATYEEWFAAYIHSSSPYLPLWESYYDGQIVPYLAKLKAYQAAVQAPSR